MRGDTFVFGYLEKKWKRLVRTLWVLYSILVFLYNVFQSSPFSSDEEIFFGVLVLLPLILSYILEPFVIKNQKKVDSKFLTHNKTNNKQALDDISAPKSLHLNFLKYLYYDGAYISGSKYWLRKFLQWPLILLGIGFYLRSVTTFARSRSLQFSVTGSILFSIYSFFIDIYVIFIFPINDKFIGVIDDMLWIFIAPVLPLAYLLFSDGKKASTTKP